ncbi:hypothetical protein SCLCIDRAFT_28786 [Scleroderma citrinum Foug A]|uniref:Uncharacterized protein n=1 Tax=Scleroderma citrinum Foug A TaxID=1036808 RepID=A0A0C3DNH8_9AGAM|nr:hypothetical protein SCLCIDRAFT_28786 [Scleroderma citrinum Foug A]
MSIESENPGGGDILHMYLGSMNWCAGDPNGLGTQTDGSGYQADGSRDLMDGLGTQMDTPNVLNSAEMASISHGDEESTYLGAGGAKRNAEVTDGFGSHMDTSSTWTGVLSARTDVNTTVNKVETISTCPVQLKLPKPPTGGENGHADETDRSRNHPSMSSTCTDVYTAEDEMETAGNKAEIVSMYLIEPKPPDPLTMGTNACANEPNGCGNLAETLTGHGESPGIEMDAETSANAIEIVRASPNEPKLPNLPIRSTRSAPDEPNSCGNRSDVSSRCMDVHGTGNDAQMAIDKAKTVRMPPNEPKMQNVPAGAERRHTGMADGFRSHTDTLTTRQDAHSIANDVGTAENTTRNVRMGRNTLKMQNSPYTPEITMPEPTNRWKRVSVSGRSVYIPVNAPIKTASRTFVFGQLERAGEVIAPDVEGKMAEGDDGGGDQDDDDGDGGRMTSSSSIDPERVKAVQLAGESHPSDIQTICMDLLHGDVDVEESKPHL